MRLIATWRMNGQTETVQDVTWLYEAGYLNVVTQVNLVLPEPEHHGFPASTRLELMLKAESA